MSDLCILSFGFFFFFFLERIRGFAFQFTICWVIIFLDWVSFTFRIDVGLFCGLALLIFFFFFLLESGINKFFFFF